ncbi:putative serine/threonine protein kinase [Blattamonas nauphoetae]|uniref:Serine/threonine protein kinase n=1 Tax=Blattamonas nauphoetae TaxID=2049346 RepID=A0ABQ9YG80_9EUKA|nr:putative serine/threonine protein kinase [Blattamonas nauphoetae]
MSRPNPHFPFGKKRVSWIQPRLGCHADRSTFSPVYTEMDDMEIDNEDEGMIDPERGSAYVYRVHSNRKNKDYVLKIVQFPKHEKLRQMVEDEVRILLKLRRRPGIIQLYNDPRPIVFPGPIKLVMELGERDLARQMEDWKMEALKKMETLMTKESYEKVFGGIANVLEAAEKSNSQIFPIVPKERHLKLIDFGMAQAIDDNKTHVQQFPGFGTHEYISPEAAGRGCQPDQLARKGKASDIWSVGMILYEMVYGVTALTHIIDTEDEPFQKLRTLISDAPITVPFVSCELAHFHNTIRKCLRKDELERPSVDDLLNSELFPDFLRRDSTIQIHINKCPFLKPEEKMTLPPRPLSVLPSYLLIRSSTRKEKDASSDILKTESPLVFPSESVLVEPDPQITTVIRILHYPLLNRTLRTTIRLANILLVQPFFSNTVNPADPHRSI